MKNFIRLLTKSKSKYPLDRDSLEWPEYSRLFMLSDNAGWVLDKESEEITSLALSLGIKVKKKISGKTKRKQSAYLPSLYMLLNSPILNWGWNVGASYYHGTPGCGNKEFDLRFHKLCENHDKIKRLHVSNNSFAKTVLQSGISPDKVQTIPIGINIEKFPLQTQHSKLEHRKQFGLPESAQVIGSFQKDGDGWGNGDVPKLIKGPDIFLDTLKLLKSHNDSLFVLLSGPSRGYVKMGLEKLGIPYVHHFLSDYDDIYKLYHCLDLYLVTSREEGGPKAVLESMATGVPIVSTRVGQARDLIIHGKRGWIAELEDVEQLADYALKALSSSPSEDCRMEQRRIAESNDYKSLKGQWKNFFDGLVTF